MTVEIGTLVIGKEDLITYIKSVKGLGNPHQQDVLNRVNKDKDGQITKDEYTKIKKVLTDNKGQFNKLADFEDLPGVRPYQSTDPFKFNFNDEFETLSKRQVNDSLTRTVYRLEEGPARPLQVVKEVERDELTGEILDKSFYIRLKGEGKLNLDGITEGGTEFTKRQAAAGVLIVRDFAEEAQDTEVYNKAELYSIFGGGRAGDMSAYSQEFQTTLLNDDPITFCQTRGLDNPFSVDI